MLKTLTVTQPNIETDVLKYVVDDDFCKVEETLAAGSGSDNVADIGTVLGRVRTATIAVGTVVQAGTGNGVLTKANPAFGNDAIAGNYKVIFTEARTNSGEFEVFRPDGTLDGRGVVGTAYTGQVKFTIADGATDFIAGDNLILPVTVTGVSYKVWPLNLAATDGSQNALEVSLSKKTATNGGTDQTIVSLRRGPAIVDSRFLIWPAGATADQIAAALEQLAANGIVARSS
jgi:hypothetical protein